MGKKYVLLSGAGENLNTYLGFRIGQYCGLKWNPDCRYVNLVINDDYRGIYLLVPALDGVSRSGHVGPNGFMVECDAYWWKEDTYFRTDGITEIMAYTVKYPDVDLLNGARFEKIKEYMNRVSGEIVDKGSSDLIDLDTFVAWIMARDITGEMDNAGSNIYYYLDDFDVDNTPQNKLQMGPLWDFDGSFASDDSWSAFHNTSSTYTYLLFADEGFMGQYVDCLRQISLTLCDLLESDLNKLIGTESQSIDACRELNAKRWNRYLPSLEEEKEEKLVWLKNRMDWINTRLTAEESGECLKNTVYATVSDDCKTMNIWLRDDGYDGVQFPVWSEKNGQDDIIWWEAQLNEDGIWECTVDLSRHHSGSIYTIHAYGRIEDENELITALNVYIRHVVEPGELETSEMG